MADGTTDATEGALANLRGEGVTFLAEPYQLGDTRAVMIEGPSREAIELVEVEDLDDPQHSRNAGDHGL